MSPKQKVVEAQDKLGRMHIRVAAHRFNVGRTSLWTWFEKKKITGVFVGPFLFVDVKSLESLLKAGQA